MEYGPPPLFNQGVSARARLAFFSFLAIALIIVDGRVKALETIRLGVGVVLYPIQQVLLIPRDVAGRIGDYFTSVASLTRENESLKREAIERARVLQESQQLAAENAELRRLAGLRDRHGGTALIAQVLYESRDRFSHKLVLDRGTKDGVTQGSPVIDEKGIVGQVTRVFAQSAEVTLLTDREQTIPVQLLRNGLRGVAYGGVDAGTLDLRFMAVNADINQGDLVVTSGLDGIYPPGLAVATVSRIERNLKDQFARVVLVPAAGVQAHNHLLLLRAEPPSIAPPPLERKAPARGAKK